MAYRELRMMDIDQVMRRWLAEGAAGRLYLQAVGEIIGGKDGIHGT